MYEQKILSELSLQVKIAGEIEFYLEPKLTSEDIQYKFRDAVIAALKAENIDVWEFGSEVAPSQYEVALQPRDPKIAIKEIERLKEIITSTAKTFGSAATFSAKPYDDLPGSGLHIHIGINDLSGMPLLSRPGEFNEREGESAIMLQAIGGLCYTMLNNFIYFAPTSESYKRFCAKRNDAKCENPLAQYNNAPVNVSWGGNNRTTAIRIPVSTMNELARHIEHRVSGADANPEQVVEAILEGIYLGIKNNLTPPEKISGNAFDKQYDFLKPFPGTIEEAKKLNN